jgi:N-acetylglucosaminyl-diphospho-decaprenol L-rhamnosyltransferase
MTVGGGLDVVIVSYRCRNLLQDCLSSLHKHRPSRPIRIGVVDNASNDGTVEMVRASFPDVELTAAVRNHGFAAANNFAIRRGHGDYVLALNPDTRMLPGTLDHMLALMDDHTDIGIAGCRLELEDGSLDHAAKRSFPTPVSALGHFTGIGRRMAKGRLADYRAPSVDRGRVDAVNGAFMLMRRRALDEVGVFDEGYWLYMEDLDLCYRFAQAGWVVWYEPAVSVIHTKAGSSGRYRTLRTNVAFHYGMYRFYRKHYAAASSTLLNVSVYVGIAAKLGLSVVRSAFHRVVAGTGAPRDAVRDRSSASFERD